MGVSEICAAAAAADDDDDDDDDEEEEEEEVLVDKDIKLSLVSQCGTTVSDHSHPVWESKKDGQTQHRDEQTTSTTRQARSASSLDARPAWSQLEASHTRIGFCVAHQPRDLLDWRCREYQKHGEPAVWRSSSSHCYVMSPARQPAQTTQGQPAWPDYHWCQCQLCDVNERISSPMRGCLGRRRHITSPASSEWIEWTAETLVPLDWPRLTPIHRYCFRCLASLHGPIDG
ncbi:hypothetical protein ElyMa_004695900 [Elysia marginata]|uniref:Uncharacterized protein n=1 Tax=Elysia marginata TaxID=1093978 RepID=A0AAV4I6D2_9GAST|nr:hypothetical protein ElyMa_004695900 [Elysia marginata]